MSPAEQPCAARSAEHSGNRGDVACAAIGQHVPGGSKALVTHNFAFQLLWCLPVVRVLGLGWHPVLPPCPSDWGCSCSTLVGMFRAVLVVAQAGKCHVNKAFLCSVRCLHVARGEHRAGGWLQGWEWRVRLLPQLGLPLCLWDVSMALWGLYQSLLGLEAPSLWG